MPNNSSRRSNEQDRTKRYKTPQTRQKSSGRPRNSDTTEETRKVNTNNKKRRKVNGKKKNTQNHEKLKMALKIAVVISYYYV